MYAAVHRVLKVVSRKDLDMTVQAIKIDSIGRAEDQGRPLAIHFLWCLGRVSYLWDFLRLLAIHFLWCLGCISYLCDFLPAPCIG